jgi:phage antirepressor YoqD-like protein
LVNERDSYVVVARLSPTFTAALVDYWQATKKPAPVALPDFNNPAVAARAWAEQYELAADRQAQLEQQQPYVDHSQALQASDEVIDMRTMAQKLTQAGFNIGRTNLFTRLIEDGILLKDKTPYRTYADWFHVEAHPYTDSNGKTHASHTVLVTAKGEAALLRKYKQPKRPVSRAVIDAPKGLGGFTRALNKAA